MRFMMLVKANADSEAGALPSKELIAAMGKFNEEMMNAGVLLSGEGLQPTSKGARVVFSTGKPQVVDGPFAGPPRDLVAGFWMIEVPSRQAAIEWASRCPAPHGEGQAAEIEIRQVFEASDFPPDIFPPEEAAREQAWRDEQQRKAARP